MGADDSPDPEQQLDPPPIRALQTLVQGHALHANAGEYAVQLPAMQTWSRLQRWPHPPQFIGSVC